MTNKNAKLLWLALFVVIVALSLTLAVNTFYLFSSKPIPQQKVNDAKNTKAEKGILKEKFLEVVPITFHIEKSQEISLSDGDAYDPKVSPDGSRIVFIRKSDGKNSLSIVELPGGTISPIEASLDDAVEPSWSSDGTKIVFSGAKKGVWEIYIYDLKGKKLQPVTNDPKRKKSWPRYSPYQFNDNYRIAYVSEENDRKDIWWVRESGQYDQPITIPEEKVAEFQKAAYWNEVGGMDPPAIVTKGGSAPEWSPSGNLLLYRASKGYSILSYTHASWWKETKASVPSSSGILSWAPNQISFLDYNTGSGKAAVIPRDSLKFKNVMQDKQLTSPPAFFPDGKGFAYTSKKEGRSFLTVEPYDDPLGDVANLWMYFYSRNQQEKLAKNQLFFLNADYDQIYSLYDTESYRCGASEEMGYHARPYLVTSDAVLETFYAVFAALYAQVEREELVGALEDFARAGAEGAREKKAAKDVENMFLTGLALLKPEFARTAPPEVRKEVEKVEKGSEKGISFFGKKLDYSDFFIRGKYERDKDLKGYFRASKWFQAFTFDLNKENERKPVAEILNVVNSSKVRPSLERIYVLYRDMIGESRYYNPINMKDIPLSGPLPPVKAPLPWIEQQEKFRLLPSVYTLDAYIFDELIWHIDRPETVVRRMLPKGLDIMAAFGSTEAREILIEELKEGQYENYEKFLSKVTDKIGMFSRNAWDTSLYQNWLDALGSLVMEPPANSPAFTKSRAWKRKQLNTALGSWVNLRYETIAVVEQVAAECGEGGYEIINIGKPRGYVEPNPVFFQRLNDGFGKVASHMDRSIKNPELKKGVAEKIAEYRKHLKILEAIARKELDGTRLSDDEYEEILNIGGTIEHFIKLMGSLNGKDEDQAIRNPEPIRKIVDVQKDLVNNVRLYEALGFVNEINVAVPFFGRRELVKGPVYSYHEFTSAEEINSEAWRKKGRQVPPVWIKEFYEGKSTSSLDTLPDLNQK